MAITVLTALVPLDANLVSLKNWINTTTINSILSVNIVNNDNILILYN